MLEVLPSWVVRKWAKRIVDHKRNHDSFPDFEVFCRFIEDLAEVACEPVTSMRGSSSHKPSSSSKSQLEFPKSPKSTLKPSVTLVSQTSQQAKPASPICPSHSNSSSSSQPRVPSKVQSRSCAYCKHDNHELDFCFSFLGKPWSERHEFIKDSKLCFGCLKLAGHRSKQCSDRLTCRTCGKSHPTSLHKAQPDTTTMAASSSNSSADSSKNANTSMVSAIAHNSASISDRCRLSTSILPVYVFSTDCPENKVLVYALLDSMSDICFVSTDVLSQVDSSSASVTIKLATMTSSCSSISCKKSDKLLVQSFYGGPAIQLPSTFSRDYIPAERSHIPTPDKALRCSHLKDIASEIPVEQQCEVGLLIGYNCPQVFIPRSVISGLDHEPFAIKSDLGWSIFGKTGSQACSDAVVTSHRVVTLPDNDDSSRSVAFALNSSVKEISSDDVVKALESDFVEKHCEEKLLSQDDILFMSILDKGVFQEDSSHYSMPLPFKTRPCLPDNRKVAEDRLLVLKRKFQKDQEYCKEYVDFMNSIIDAGEAEKVSTCSSCKVGQMWYIPHFGVRHPKKKKLRVVFDCSVKFQGSSLNDNLLQGPDMMNSMIGILLRFRKDQVAILGDIQKMYHQFRVHEADRDFLRFLWFDDESLSNVADFRMNVHLFGATSSPACATYGLRAIAKDYCDLENPYSVMARDFILSNFYVDDGILSLPDAKTASLVLAQAREICSKGGVRLHKIVSNSPEVMSSVPVSEHAEGFQNMEFSERDLPNERTLGVHWSVRRDEFEFKLSDKVSDKAVSRRAILSVVASVYDPLGFLAPFILRGKKILQHMCSMNIAWDDSIPSELHVLWLDWLEELKCVIEIQIPRRYFSLDIAFDTFQSIELHCFCDASEFGYSQCSFLRVVVENKVFCSFVMGKSRVAPRKSFTIPRLELQAAVLSARIASMILRELSHPHIKLFLWTDSAIVLGYIHNQAKRFHTYVANRVQTIRNLSQPNEWYHVKSELNPADIGSRGCRVEDLESQWLKPPLMLLEHELPIESAKRFSVELAESDPEVKQNIVLLSQPSTDRGYVLILKLIEKFSSWEKAVNLIRFFTSKAMRVKQKPHSLVEAKLKAVQAIIRAVQHEVYASELSRLENSECVLSSSSLVNLDPFLDRDGLIRVGGRLGLSDLEYSQKHPVVLPKSHHVSQLVIGYYHKLVAHQGRGLTINSIRSNGFWIVCCSKVVSSFIHHCVTCRKQRGKVMGQKMSAIPPERTETNPPFTVCGMDCFGPFHVTEYRRQKKVYGIIFTCFALRAVHIELVSDLSTDSFINALRCFIAVRGNVQEMHCDRGSNFVGGCKELHDALHSIQDSEVRAAFAKYNCNFTFNTPTASHMGGIWESLIRPVRSILNNLVQNSGVRLTSEELRTLFYETMAIINSRPLTVQNLNDVNSLEPLTPNHLLTMKSEVVLPPGNFCSADMYCRKRWKKVQCLANQFWTRWRKEYLITLQQRHKWHKPKCNIKLGAVVLIVDENSHRSEWKIGRITKLLPSKDGEVRRVTLQVGTSSLSSRGKRLTTLRFLDRPIHKLVMILE
jgi:hypothetical protein